MYDFQRISLYPGSEKYLAPTNKPEFWPSQACEFFIKKLFYPRLFTCIKGLFERICIKYICLHPQTILQPLHYDQEQKAVKVHWGRQCTPAQYWDKVTYSRQAKKEIMREWDHSKKNW